MSTFMDMWLRAAAEATALRHQVAHLEALWLRAEAEADRWYYVANNAPEIRRQHAAMLRDFDVAQARAGQDAAWRLLDELAAKRAAEAVTA